MKDCAIFNLILHNVLFAFSYSLVYNYLYNYVCHYKGDLISMSLPIPKQASTDSACFSDNLTDIGICVFDQNGKFLYMNDSFLKIRNVTRAFYESRTAFDLLHNNLIDKCVLDSVREKKIPLSDVQNVVSPDGSCLRKQLVTVYPIFDEANSIKNYIAYYQNLESFIDFGTTVEISEDDSSSFFIGDSRIIAENPTSKVMYAKAQEVADTDATVLITGESGTGKEVLARFIHASSNRRDQEMITVDCMALPSALVEAELFGYEKGSFTGANQSKAGLIEAADHGTLFLDELNSLPLELQGKLLRTIETKTVKRIGSLKFRQVDFRLIVASNVDLLQCVKNKTFRLDLYYRINVLAFHIQPLRRRPEDIIPLARAYEKIFQERYKRNRAFSANLYREMLAYSWPGNVRELKNFVERLVIMGPEDALLSVKNIASFLPDSQQEDTGLQEAEAAADHSILPVGMPEDILAESGSPDNTDLPQPSAPPKNSRSRSSDPEEEKVAIMEALRINQNHREKTAAYLHISRRTLQYKLKKYGLL